MTAPSPPLAWLRCPRCERIPEVLRVWEDPDPGDRPGERWQVHLHCSACAKRGRGVGLCAYGPTEAAAEAAARRRWSQRWPESDEAVDHHREDLARHHDEVEHGLVREGWTK
jgi:hypothetical protein